MDNRLILFGLHEIEGVGWQTIKKLSQRYPAFADWFDLSKEEIALTGIRREIAARIAELLTPSFIEHRLHIYRKHSITFITRLDAEYPSILHEISQPPWILYYKGDPSFLNRHSLGIVGTRVPTHYGKKVASDLAAALSDAGFTIVSGLARGIDSQAHQGALHGKSSTVAVLGCAINDIYPKDHAPLYRIIEQKGIVISEYPIGTKMHQGMFPQRNRIIAGLSLGVVVVEAAMDSGSLITANFAADESRDVFAIPGHITSRQSQGVHKLLRCGARIVTRAEDIVNDYQYLLSSDELEAFRESSVRAELSEEEHRIVQMLSNIPVSIDELLERSQFTFGHLHAVLLSLLLKKAIKQLPGSTYILA